MSGISSIRQHRMLLLAGCGLALGAGCMTASPAQGVARTLRISVGTGTSPLDQPPRNWAIEAAKNELPVIQYTNVFLRYKIHMVGARGDQVRDVIESRDGSVARLVLRDGRPLTPDEDAAERERLQGMIDSPSAFERHIRSDRTGKKLAIDLIHLTPDAMLFSYAPGQPQRRPPAAGVAPEIVMDFKPDPNWSPPTMSAEALTGFQGRLWIDQGTRHVTHLDGNIFRGMNFGWGMLAHINPGGTVSVEQQAAGDGRWIVSHFEEHISLRALMIKTMNENSKIDGWDFAEIPVMSYQDAIKTLLATPLPRH